MNKNRYGGEKLRLWKWMKDVKWDSPTAGFYDPIFTPKMLNERLGMSKYKARILLKLLKDDGLVEYRAHKSPCDYDYEHGCCYCDNHLPIWGYTLKERDE